MTLEANVLRDDALRSTPEGYEVDVHIAWYRSLPLSCIENVRLAIDGQVFEKDQVKILVEGKKCSFADLAEMSDKWWFVQDAITVSLQSDAPAAKGKTVNLDVSLATRIPYVIIGPDIALVQRTDVSKEVTVQ